MLADSCRDWSSTRPLLWAKSSAQLGHVEVFVAGRRVSAVGSRERSIRKFLSWLAGHT